ncbi:hypothetical protein LTR36_000958 [Oleoguttula mirabilis]|uniref:Luciferase domain-containing protein n=1 Tax=Oleoguttula mirabilis TaxID=1507867 RepID=A0AAV9JS07_9PEZI|nr:hypothetical protein LTR36_000958 [Oleoguttula mirabilis]
MVEGLGLVVTPAALLHSSQTLKLVAIFTALTAVLTLLLHLYREYLAFVSLGPGGTPPTIAGFLRVKVLGCFALQNPYQPAPIPPRFKDSPGYLVNLPIRQAPRPETRGIAPHRQITQKPSKAVYEKLAQEIQNMGASNDNLLIGTSCFEKHGTGLFSVSPAKRTCQGEICHAHPSDGSMHMTLHPADAKTVLEAGWAERHPIARGGWFERFVPGGFLMVYAPRNDEEIETVMRIVKAAAWFVSGRDGVREIGKDSVKEIAEERRDSGYVSAEEAAQ